MALACLVSHVFGTAGGCSGGEEGLYMGLARLVSHVFGTAGGCSGGEEGLDMKLARPVSHADFQAAMKKVGPSITRGSEVSVSPGLPLYIGL